MDKFCAACGERVDRTPPYQCPSCDERFWANPKPCAGALVEHRGEVLLIRRAFDPWDGHWDIPGGFVEFGEHPEDAAQRELLEETGLTAPITGLIGMWMDDYDMGDLDDPSDALSLCNIYYVAVIPDDAERPTPALDPKEASEYAWFGPHNLPSPIGFPSHQPDVIYEWAAKRNAGTPFHPLPARHGRFS